MPILQGSIGKVAGATGVLQPRNFNDLHWQRPLSATTDPKSEFAALATPTATVLPMVAAARERDRLARIRLGMVLPIT